MGFSLVDLLDTKYMVQSPAKIGALDLMAGDEIKLAGHRQNKEIPKDSIELTLAKNDQKEVITKKEFEDKVHINLA